MSSAFGLILLIGVVGFILWLFALADVLTAADDPDQNGRLLLGLMLIVVAPVGVLMWLARGRNLAGGATYGVLLGVAGLIVGVTVVSSYVSR